MDKFLDKKYKVVRCENFEKFLEEIGVGKLKIKIAKSKTLSSIIQLTKQPDKDDRFIFKTISMKLMKSEIEFGLGEEFVEKTICGGYKVKSTITFDGNKMTHIQKFDGSACNDKTVIIERRFFPDEMITISNLGEVTSTIWYKALD